MNRPLAALLQTMTDTLQIDCESIRQTLHEWRAEQESFDAQLTESLSALAAYQSHLDAWQKQLAHEREQLRAAREQFEHERGRTDGAQAGLDPNGAETGELSAAREKISALSASLLARTEELRQMDEKRSELAAELELNRVREKELAKALEEQKQALEQERAHRDEELRNLERLKQGAEGASPSEKSPENLAAAAGRAPQQVNENPVLGSIVEQFGKLRQQRALDRQALRKPR
jgi:septal ring factor EnvC (AmiA/AmiB activator)